MTRDPLIATMQFAMLATVAVSMLTLGACRERRYGEYLHPRDTISLSAGDAVAQNKAVHTIDPWPAHSRNPNHVTDGKRMMVGMERYQKNESLEPQGMGVSDKFEDQSKPPPKAPPAP